MRFRDLGHSGIKVSEIGLGAWQLGGPLRGYFSQLGWISHGWGDLSDEDGIDLVRVCGEAGINFIDTAAGYGAGHSEELVGRAIRDCRDRWVIETKGGEAFTADGINVKEFSRDRLLGQIDESLRRLATDYVDVYLLHGPSQADIEKGECLDALARIKQAGKARLVGVSLGPNAMGLELVARGGMDVFQVPLSLTNAHDVRDLLRASAAAGIGIVARCAMGAGFLAGGIDEKTDFAENDRRSWQPAEGKRSAAATAEAFRFLEVPGRTLAQACLKFPLSFSEVSTVIPGSKSADHMRENAAASAAPALTAAELAGIEKTRQRLQA